MRLALRLALACLINLTLTCGALAAPRIWVVMSEEGGVYVETVVMLRAELGQDAEVVSGTPSALFHNAASVPDLIVTVGVAALDATLEQLPRAGESWSQVPLLATLLPRVVFDARRATKAVVRRPMSAVVLDQPLARQLALIRLALPDVRRVGVLPSPQTRPLLRQLAAEASARGLKLVVGDEVRYEDEIFPSLRTTLEEAEVVLALPDAQIFNGATLQNILLTAYRARVPLVAFSSAYVRAGAALGLHSTPAQVARSAAAMVRQWAGGRGLPPPRAPKEFVVTTNDRVASSLSIRLAEAATITEALRREEENK